MFRTIIEPFKIKVVEPIRMTTRGMEQLFRTGLLVTTFVVGIPGCATTPPPSEPTIAGLRSSYNSLMARAAAGELTPAQAHDTYFAELEATRPPLPDLDSLKELRTHLAAQIQTRTLTPEQAESILKRKESELLARWAQLSARYAQEQREIQRMRSDYEEGYWQQKQLEQGEKVFRDRPRF